MVNAGFGSVNVKKGHDPEREERAQQWRSTPLRLYDVNANPNRPKADRIA